MNKNQMLFDIAAVRLDNLSADEIDRIAERCVGGEQFAGELARIGARTKLECGVNLMEDLVCSWECNEICQKEGREYVKTLRQCGEHEGDCLETLYRQLSAEIDFCYLAELLTNFTTELQRGEQLAQGCLAPEANLDNGRIFVFSDTWDTWDGKEIECRIYIFDRNTVPHMLEFLRNLMWSGVRCSGKSDEESDQEE